MISITTKSSKHYTVSQEPKRNHPRRLFSFLLLDHRGSFFPLCSGEVDVKSLPSTTLLCRDIAVLSLSGAPPIKQNCLATLRGPKTLSKVLQ